MSNSREPWSQDFINELAQSLDAELNSTQNKGRVSQSSLAYETYVALCHDDPQVERTGVDALNRSLISNQEFALSEKLIEGIRQLLSQEDGTTKESVSALAWTVFGRIPLECCLTEDLDQASKWIGSYRGVAVALEDDEDYVKIIGKDDTRLQAALNDDKPKPPTDDTAIDSPRSELKHDEYEEVWAAESDPSDYEFESGYDYQAKVAELENWAEQQQVDPRQLSKPLPDCTWYHVAQVVISLLHNLRYNCIHNLSAQQWKDQHVSNKLTQLAMLLVVPSGQHSPVFEEYTSSIWQRVSLYAIHTFRDAALDEPGVRLKDYLSLLRQLIHVHEASESKAVATSLAPATWMGVTLLSSLCSHITSEMKSPARLAVVRNMIFAVVADLSVVLERSFSSEARPAVPWTMAAIFDIITEENLSSIEGQVCLSCGLLREWLKWWENSSEVQKPIIEESLRKLSVSSPKLIGKYVWRYPGFAGYVTKNGLPINILLWSLTGMALADTSLGAVKWKNTAVSTSAPSLDECQKLSWDFYQEFMHRGESVLQEFDINSDGSNLDSFVMEFQILLDALSAPIIRSEFTTRMCPGEGDKKTEIQSKLLPLQIRIKELPTATAIPERRKVKTEEENTSTDLKPGDREVISDEIYKSRSNVSRLNNLRKIMKLFLATTDEEDFATRGNSSKTD